MVEQLDVVQLGLVQEHKLRRRFEEAPNVTNERLNQGLADIEAAFTRRNFDENR